MFMPYVGGVRGYRRILEKVRENDFEGLSLTKSPATAVAS